ncbi:unnamed protein product [Porites evermanni]|uniref:CHAT domain-containing protein n=1 Tax=Porites evermanni TaxID=104178 RepID=A0ABN8R3S5_9CNID|nr:unnamed protein product [Porites evermanni]
MDNILEILQTFCTGVDVATFLFNTGRIIKAVDIFNECLVLLNGKALETIKELTTPFLIYVYRKLLDGYTLVYDHTRAIECGKKLLVTLHNSGQKEKEGIILLKLANIYYQRSKYEEAKQFCEKALSIMIETGNNRGVGTCYGNLGTVFRSVGQYTKAEEYLQTALVIRKEIGDKKGEAADYGNLGTVFLSVGQYTKAEEYLQKALVIRKEIGDKHGEASAYGNLGTVFRSVGQYTKAEEYHQTALAISKEIGDKQGEAAAYGNLGTVFRYVGQYTKAEEYVLKALVIMKEIGDKHGEASAYDNLGSVFQYVGQYTKAEEYLHKALVIKKEIGDKEGEAAAYGNLGTMFKSVGQYTKAKEYLQTALVISKEIGDKRGEASAYGNLGNVFQSVGQHTKAEEYLQKALVISKEIGDKKGEAADYGNLGTVFLSVGQYTKAEEYLQKAQVISKEIGDKQGEAADYGNLGTVFKSFGQYAKAEEYLQKALVIRKEIGDKEGEAVDYGNLGIVFLSVGQHTKAEEYLQKALVISKEIGDKKGEASAYGNLGTVFKSVGQYAKAEEYLQKALVIGKEIGDKEGEAFAYGNLGTVFQSVGQYTKAEECLQTALVIRKEIGDKAGVWDSYLKLEKLFAEFQLAAKSQEFAIKALEISYEIGDIEMQFNSHLAIALNELLAGGSITEGLRNLHESIQKCEEMHDFLRMKDQFKISFFDEHVSPYLLLCRLLIAAGSNYEALYVAELGRSRALTDVLSDKYSVEKGVSVNPQSWIGIENIMNKNALSSCLYVSCFDHNMYFWILKPNKMIVFRQTRLKESADKVFGNQTFGGSLDLRQDQCEDRSLFSCVSSPLSCKQSQSDSFESLRRIEEEEGENHDTKPLTLADGYNMIVAPVADLLQESEIIIIPDNLLYPIPFAALKDGNGKYLSDTFRIRIVPSLTTLKLIQLSPADYHSKTGALIVGEPDVSDVYYQGKFLQLNPLPSARKEAEMIGRLLGVQPLLGKDATKQAVLKSMHLVSLIHFAAHGYAERGEIALSPISSCGTPHEEDYLLTMAEISQVQLTAKLVVLSCCHSASGQVRAEGIVGIARAFLASGARAVLASLWAVDDEATEWFMNCFYKHLVRGESASESLHQAMKSMRETRFSDVEQWAPFMLIGDNVTFKDAFDKSSLKDGEDATETKNL